MRFLMLTVLCLFSPLVQADVLATASMKEGAKLHLFTDKKDCELGQSSVLIASSHAPLRGCWVYEEGSIYVKYHDGDIRVYKTTTFKFREVSVNNINL